MERNERLKAADKCASRYTNENEARIAKKAFMLGCEFEAQGEAIKGVILDTQQEPSIEDCADALLNALSKSPYNNKPITDAQVIVKELLVFLKEPNKYNPNAILQEPDVDFEKEIEKEIEMKVSCKWLRYGDECGKGLPGTPCEVTGCVAWEDYEDEKV